MREIYLQPEHSRNLQAYAASIRTPGARIDQISGILVNHEQEPLINLFIERQQEIARFMGIADSQSVIEEQWDLRNGQVLSTHTLFTLLTYRAIDFALGDQFPQVTDEAVAAHKSTGDYHVIDDSLKTLRKKLSESMGEIYEWSPKLVAVIDSLVSEYCGTDEIKETFAYLAFVDTASVFRYTIYPGSEQTKKYSGG